MATPIVSIIIPCHNQGQYLDEAIESAKAQTYSAVEIVVIDDGSTDEATQQLIKALSDRPELKVLTQENTGVAAARNRAIEQASGDYILPLDSDDKIHPEYVARAMERFLATEPPDIVYCRAELFGATNGEWNIPSYSFPEILFGNQIFVSALFRKSEWQAVGGFDTTMEHGWEDYDIWLAMIERGAQVEQLPDVLFYYRQHAESGSRKFTIDQKADTFKALFAKHQDLYTKNIRAVFSEILQLQSQVQAAEHDRNNLLAYIEKLENHVIDLEKTPLEPERDDPNS